MSGVFLWSRGLLFIDSNTQFKQNGGGGGANESILLFIKYHLQSIFK